MTDVTRLWHAVQQGNQQAAEELLPLVYDELRALAAARMARENPAHTLDATALVHEAYLKLVGDREFADKQHFFRVAAEAMRQILVDRARRKRRERHGGDRQRAGLSAAATIGDATSDDLLALDDCLRRLFSRRQTDCLRES